AGTLRCLGWARRDGAPRDHRRSQETPRVGRSVTRPPTVGRRKAQTARTTERQNMLALTDAAAEAISALTAQEEGAGLRFAVQEESEEEAQLALSVVAAPEQEDQVLGTEGGARVF